MDDIDLGLLPRLRPGMSLAEANGIMQFFLLDLLDSPAGLIRFFDPDTGTIRATISLAEGDRIGRIEIWPDFPPGILTGPLRTGAPIAEALGALMDVSVLPPLSDGTAEGMIHHAGRVASGAFGDTFGGLHVIVTEIDGRVDGIAFDDPDATDGALSLPAALQPRDGMRAYDLEIAARDVDPACNQGWVFGLPPGITPEQWPLDPLTGYPLMHGFTLELPEDYRIHGPGVVALSFFATAAEQVEGPVTRQPALAAAILGQEAGGADDPSLAPFRKRAASAHPRLHRMTDVLDYAYAVILLTEAEFRSPWCPPPEMGANRWLLTENRPRWLTIGSAAAFWGAAQFDSYHHPLMGGRPEPRPDWHRAITRRARRLDPNAGIPPAEVFDEPSELGYQPRWIFPEDPELDDPKSDALPVLQPWAEDHLPNHIGGTINPAQGVLAFSPFIIGFEEWFGGFNFGTGNAQLDFLQMRFDWAC